MMIKTLPKSWPLHVGFRDSATIRPPNHTFTLGASESKTLEYNLAENHFERFRGFWNDLADSNSIFVVAETISF